MEKDLNLPAAVGSRPPCPRCVEFAVNLLNERIKAILAVYGEEGDPEGIGESHCFHLMEIRSILEGQKTCGVYDDYGPPRTISGPLFPQGASALFGVDTEFSNLRGYADIYNDCAAELARVTKERNDANSLLRLTFESCASAIAENPVAKGLGPYDGNPLKAWHGFYVWLREKLAALKQERGWRPMSTAPRDGTEILVAFRQHGVQSVSWAEGNGITIWCVDDHKHGPFPVRGYTEDGVLGWMPLPAMPVAAIDAARTAQQEGKPVESRIQEGKQDA